VASEDLFERIRLRLARSPTASATVAGMPAAVLIPLVDRSPEPTVLLTLRADHLTDHAGQISFPGGRVEPGDRDAVATALRETHEEIGMAADRVEVLGCMPEQHTGTGFAVLPVVGRVRADFGLSLNTEVAEAFEVPLSFVLDTANHRLETAVLRGAPRTYYVLTHGERRIWGATAAILVDLAALIARAAA
jgi:8-oxo-dGTP pyrophosphatase MutT (NUDIX family)